MEHYSQIINAIAHAMGVAWASGINLYAAIFVLGIFGTVGDMALPPNLQILTHPVIICVAGGMYLLEFVADKIPGVDTAWNTVHTFIYIPAGAILASQAVGNVDPVVAITAGLIGGGITASTHVTKTGAKAILLEPTSNWTASVIKDASVIGGLWAALTNPLLFIVLLIAFILLMIWLLPRIWKGVKKVFGFLWQWLEYRGSGGRGQDIPDIPPRQDRSDWP